MKPGGYLVYFDLTVPAWLAMRLRSVFGSRAGVFTGDDLDRAFAALRLKTIHKTTSSHSYDAVFVK